MSHRVLLIEDNRDIADLVAMHLRDMACEVTICMDGLEGLAEALRGGYELLILDLMLPGLDGLQICRKLREAPNYTPVLMLTAKSCELDRVLGLEIGADDYLTKPFSIRELLARAKAIFRRVEALRQPVAGDSDPVISAGELRIDTARRSVRLAGREVELTAKEFDLLTHFARQPGRVLSRAQLLDGVWGYGHDGYEHTVNSNINRLRTKIERDPSKPRYILTVWGVGYKFTELESNTANSSDMSVV